MILSVKQLYALVGCGLLLMMGPGVLPVVLETCLAIAGLLAARSLPQDDWHRVHLKRFFWRGSALMTILVLLAGGGIAATTDMSAYHALFSDVMQGQAVDPQQATQAVDTYVRTNAPIIRWTSVATFAVFAVYVAFEVRRGLKAR